jgi:hypothetical protein
MASPRPQTWYDARRGDAHEAVFAQVDYISRQQSQQRDDVVEQLELYYAGNVTGLGQSTATSRYFHADEEDDGIEVRFNVAAAGVDTAISLISQAPVIPQYLSVEGDFKLIRKADKCSKILQGQMTAEVKEMIKRAALDATQVGTGFLFECFDPMTGLPGAEREHLLNVFVEHTDGLNMKPRSMHRGRIVPKETLKAQFPKFATAIDTCEGVTRTTHNNIFLSALGDGFSFDDFVYVVESWHLRPGPKAKGRRTICVRNATLRDDKYMHDDFPCAVFRYRERSFGFFGAGLIESCRPTQNRINNLLRVHARALNLGSNLVLLNPNGEGEVSHEEFTNDIGLIINYNPLVGPPTLAKWEGGLDDVQRQIDVELQRWLMSEGISAEQMNGQGAGKGLDSGTAVRAADDVQSRRLVPFTSRFQQSCMSVAKLFERMNDDVSERDPEFRIQVVGSEAQRTFLKTANWLEIRPKQGDARLTMAQMSALPTTPQGRWAAVQDWLQGGFVSRNYAMSLLEFPDLSAYASNELAHLDYARWQMELILDGENPIPDPRQDLDLAIDLAVKCKFQAAIMRADEEILNAFEDFVVYAEEMKAQAEPPPVPAAMPGGMPGAPPAQSPLGLPVGQVVAPGLGQVA